MDETYRVLGRERQADLEREAARRRLAEEARPAREPRKPVGLRACLEAAALAVARLPRNSARADSTT